MWSPAFWIVDRVLAAAVARCEAVARNNGHTLGVWHRVDERLHASICEVCAEMVWVARPAYEKRWRVGGTTLEQDCLKDDMKSLLELRK